ncbi:hypothetical protein DL89DRAFT_170957 [Linderina pennispora]|uniref:Uncharacterized protein n=1 Tax=Linderina pennispora TaxID=61395 RepID=A0A1Y1W6W8_9FUNG|nr:uncharacterized protein DL89DRAFT_170957 [Linderina pennispora]ORX69078.1 hypothetical protein DL89DRAFT_170957 [Linderina pennispora]
MRRRTLIVSLQRILFSFGVILELCLATGFRQIAAWAATRTRVLHHYASGFDPNKPKHHSRSPCLLLFSCSP